MTAAWMTSALSGNMAQAISSVPAPEDVSSVGKVVLKRQRVVPDVPPIFVPDHQGLVVGVRVDAVIDPPDTGKDRIGE